MRDVGCRISYIVSRIVGGSRCGGIGFVFRIAFLGGIKKMIGREKIRGGMGF